MKENKSILESVRRGLKEKATIYRGSFAKYVEEELFEFITFDIAGTNTVTDIATKYLKG